MKAFLFTGFLILFVISACTPLATPTPDPTNSPDPTNTPAPEPEPTNTASLLFFGTSMPPMATFAPTPTFASNLEQTISIEYTSVAAALVGLRTREDVAVVVRQGWVLILEADGYTTWTFTPPDHAANPTVAKRTLYRDQDGWHIAMKVQCEAEQAACDDFVRQFTVINNEMLTHLEPQR